MVESGYIDNPILLYDMTVQELGLLLRGKYAKARIEMQNANIRAGSICAQIFNQHRTKRSDKVLKWSDFFPDVSIKKSQSVSDMKRVCKEIALAFGGKVIKK